MSLTESQRTLTWQGENENSTVSDFLSCGVLNCFAQVCSKLSKKARQPFQLKLIVKYDSTIDSENYGGKMGGGGGGLQSETSFWINFQLKLSKEKNNFEGVVFWKLRFNFHKFKIHIVNQGMKI